MLDFRQFLADAIHVLSMHQQGELTALAGLSSGRQATAEDGPSAATIELQRDSLGAAFICGTSRLEIRSKERSDLLRDAFSASEDQFQMGLPLSALPQLQAWIKVVEAEDFDSFRIMPRV